MMAWRRAPSMPARSAAHRSAQAEPRDPSTPTTIRSPAASVSVPAIPPPRRRAAADSVCPSDEPRAVRAVPGQACRLAGGWGIRSMTAVSAATPADGCRAACACGTSRRFPRRCSHHADSPGWLAHEHGCWNGTPIASWLSEGSLWQKTRRRPGMVPKPCVLAVSGIGTGRWCRTEPSSGFWRRCS